MSAQPCTCDEVIPLLDAYHDGELSGAEESLVSSHLVSCTKCPSRLKEIENLVGSLKGMPKLAMARDLSVDDDFLKKALEQEPVAASGEVDNLKATTESTLESASKPTVVLTAGDIADFSANNPLLPRSNAVGPLAIAFLSAAAAITLAITIPPMLKNQKANAPAIAEKSPVGEENRLSGNADHNGDSSSEKNQVALQPRETDKSPVEPEPARLASPRVAIHPDLALHERRDLIRSHFTHDGSLQAMLPDNASTAQPATSEIANSAGANDPSIDSPTSAQVNSDEATQAPEIASAGAPAIMPSDEHASQSVSVNNDQPEILAAYPTDSSAAPEELGLSTDEDGLYAFKM